MGPMGRWWKQRRERFDSRELAGPVLAAAALGVFAAYDLFFDVDNGPITCAVLALTGWPCPGCGMTRSVVALSNGQLAASFEQHPLGWIVVVGLVSVILSWCVGVIRNRPPTRFLSGRLLSVIVVAFLVIWIVRLTV